MKIESRRLKNRGSLLIAIGVVIWLVAVIVSNEPSKFFFAAVYFGWATALAGVFLHVAAFFWGTSD